MARVALIGAGGKMGCRIADNFAKTDHDVRHVEVSEPGRARLRERGLTAQPTEQALADAEVVILAVPDNRIGMVCEQLNPNLKSGMMVIVLDAAAPSAGDLPKRDDLTFFVAHPCHPPIFNDETDPEARSDFFGGIKAKQHIVCALAQGPESAYALGEKIGREIYAPI